MIILQGSNGIRLKNALFAATQISVKDTIIQLLSQSFLLDDDVR